MKFLAAAYTPLFFFCQKRQLPLSSPLMYKLAKKMKWHMGNDTQLIIGYSFPSSIWEAGKKIRLKSFCSKICCQFFPVWSNPKNFMPIKSLLSKKFDAFCAGEIATTAVDKKHWQQICCSWNVEFKRRQLTPGINKVMVVHDRGAFNTFHTWHVVVAKSSDFIILWQTCPLAAALHRPTTDVFRNQTLMILSILADSQYVLEKQAWFSLILVTFLTY